MESSRETLEDKKERVLAGGRKTITDFLLSSVEGSVDDLRDILVQWLEWLRETSKEPV